MNKLLTLRPERQDGERGQGMAEYIIIVILVAIIVLVAIKYFGRSVYSQFTNATSEVNDLKSGAPGEEEGEGGGE